MTSAEQRSEAGTDAAGRRRAPVRGDVDGAGVRSDDRGRCRTPAARPDSVGVRRWSRRGADSSTPRPPSGSSPASEPRNGGGHRDDQRDRRCPAPATRRPHAPRLGRGAFGHEVVRPAGRASRGSRAAHASPAPAPSSTFSRPAASAPGRESPPRRPGRRRSRARRAAGAAPSARRGRRSRVPHDAEQQGDEVVAPADVGELVRDHALELLRVERGDQVGVEHDDGPADPDDRRATGAARDHADRRGVDAHAARHAVHGPATSPGTSRAAIGAWVRAAAAPSGADTRADADATTGPRRPAAPAGPAGPGRRRCLDRHEHRAAAALGTMRLGRR